MNFSQLKAIVDVTKPNPLSDTLKKRWTKVVENRLVNEVIDGYIETIPRGLALTQRGSCALSALPVLIDVSVGDVWVITEDAPEPNGMSDYIDKFWRDAKNHGYEADSAVDVITKATVWAGTEPGGYVPYSYYVSQGNVYKGDLAICVQIANEKRWYLAHSLRDYIDYAVENDQLLLLPEPYDEMYRHYLEGQISYTLEDFSNYQNSTDQFNIVLDDLKKYLIRHNKPKAKGLIYV